MSHKPKSVREIYLDSLNVNLRTLAKQLDEQGVRDLQIKEISQSISGLYGSAMEKIAEATEADMMAIENAPSPLELFIECISKLMAVKTLDPLAISLLQGYVSTMQEWM